MNCISCGVDVSPSFKHAFSQNICPACGGSLIDEESLALIEDLETTISSEATLRVETAHKLAIALIAKYDVQIRDGAVKSVPKRQQNIKIAQSSTKKLIEENNKIMNEEQLKRIANDGEISDAEREEIMADVVSKKYGMVDQLSAQSLKGDEFNELQGLNFSDSDEVPILEKERMLRLQKQQQALNGGKESSFRRSS